MHDTVPGWLATWERSPCSCIRHHNASCPPRVCYHAWPAMAALAWLWPGRRWPGMRSRCCNRWLHRDGAAAGAITLPQHSHCCPASRWCYRRHYDAVLRCRSPWPRMHVGCPGCLASSPRLNGAVARHAAPPLSSTHACGLAALSHSERTVATSGLTDRLPPR